MKKICMLALATLALVACEGEKDPQTFPPTNEQITAEGSIAGENLHFAGTVSVSSPMSPTPYEEEVHFEFAGDVEDFVLYMHQTRFVAQMPKLDMRLREIGYTPAGEHSMQFSVAGPITPQARMENEQGGGYSYQDKPEYAITNLQGHITNTACEVSFTCMGAFHVAFTGRLFVEM